MGIAHICWLSSELLNPMGDGDGFGPQADLTQIHRDQATTRYPHLFQACAGGYGELTALDQLVIQKMTREEPQPIAAHLRQRAIGVAIVHEPQPGIEIMAWHLPSSHYPQHAIRPDTGVPITELSDHFRSQLLHAMWIVDDDEVVAGGMTLDKRVPEQSVHLSF
jgi:hypothetical protein